MQAGEHEANHVRRGLSPTEKARRREIAGKDFSVRWNPKNSMKGNTVTPIWIYVPKFGFWELWGISDQISWKDKVEPVCATQKTSSQACFRQGVTPKKKTVKKAWEGQGTAAQYPNNHSGKCVTLLWDHAHPGYRRTRGCQIKTNLCSTLTESCFASGDEAHAEQGNTRKLHKSKL